MTQTNRFGRRRRPYSRPHACEICGRPITQARWGRPRLYCRPSCRQRAYERRRQEEALAAVRADRDRWAAKMAAVRDLAEQVTPFAYSAPDAWAPDPAWLSIALVEAARGVRSAARP